MKTAKIKGRFVIGHNGRNHVLYRDGEVVYRGDTIIFVGRDYNEPVDEIIDTGLSIVGPGFIDLEADIDTDHAHIDIAFPKKPEDAFRMADRLRTTDPYTDEDFRIRQIYSIAQLIKNGITTAMPIEGESFHSWSQSYREHEIMANVGIDMGMRLYVGPSFKSFSGVGIGYDEARSEQSLADAFRHFEDFDGKANGRIRGFVNPCQIRWTTADVLVRAMEFARSKNAPMRLHACEGLGEWEYVQKLVGKTTIYYFDELGLLCKNLLIPHCFAAKDSELKLLAKNDVSVISTPFAEIQGGGALNSFAKYQALGINMTIGTDAQPLDMIRNMRLARDLDAVCRNHGIYTRYQEDGQAVDRCADEPRYDRLSAADFYNAATVNGAKALGRDDIGKLARGAKADIIAINLDDVIVGPYEDPIRTMLVSTVGKNVSHTIIDGKLLMKDHRLLYVDEGALMRRAQIVYEKYLDLFEEYDAEKRSKHLFFMPSFPYSD